MYVCLEKACRRGSLGAGKSRNSRVGRRVSPSAAPISSEKCLVWAVGSTASSEKCLVWAIGSAASSEKCLIFFSATLASSEKCLVWAIDCPESP